MRQEHRDAGAVRARDEHLSHVVPRAIEARHCGGLEDSGRAIGHIEAEDGAWVRQPKERVEHVGIRLSPEKPPQMAPAVGSSIFRNSLPEMSWMAT